MTLYINCCPRMNSRTGRLARALLKKLGEYEELRLYDEPIRAMDSQRLPHREELLDRGELDGEIFECAVPEKEFPLFEKQYLVLGARQEHGYLKVRYYDPDGSFARAGKLKEEWKPVLCAANLEDVFLVSYGDEKTEVIL